MQSIFKRILFLFFLLMSISTAQAQEPPKFLFPLACAYGRDCWAVNYVDVDPAEGKVADFRCNAKTYDAHKGTDFALGSVAHMQAGVDVLAAAGGTVLRVRDGETDILKTSSEMETIRSNSRECGNGVLIDHGNGLQTMYCHLKQGSIIVQPKQKISAGEKIAQVGQSGLAEFPHLHFGVFWEGGIIDPYTGLLDREGCGKMKHSLWADEDTIIYEPVAIFDGGFRAQTPDFAAIQRGEANPETLGLNSAALVFWAGFYNVEDGDRVTLEIRDPAGKIFHQWQETVSQNRARQYYFTGRRIGNVQLMSGTYTGTAKLIRSTRGQHPFVERKREFTVKIAP